MPDEVYENSISRHRWRKRVPISLSVVAIVSAAFTSFTLALPIGETSPLPLGLAFCSFFLRRKLPVWLLGIMIVLTLGSIYSIAIDIPPFVVIKQSAAYLMPLSLYAVSRNLTVEGVTETCKIFKKISYFFSAIIIIQELDIPFPGMEITLDFLTQRASIRAWEGRGVGAWFNEPSHASFATIFLFAVCYIGGRLNHSKFEIGYAWFFLGLGCLLTGSGTGALLLLVLLFATALRAGFLKISLPAFGALVIVSILGLQEFRDVIPPRILYILNEILNVDTVDFFETSIFLSGFRFVSVLTAYYYALVNPFFNGIGVWQIQILQAYESLGYDIGTMGHFKYGITVEATKPYSFFANVAMDCGWAAVSVICFFLWRVFSLAKKATDPTILGLIVVSVFSLLFLGTTGNPQFFIIIGLLHNLLERKSLK